MMSTLILASFLRIFVPTAKNKGNGFWDLKSMEERTKVDGISSVTQEYSAIDNSWGTQRGCTAILQSQYNHAMRCTLFRKSRKI